MKKLLGIAFLYCVTLQSMLATTGMALTGPTAQDDENFTYQDHSVTGTLADNDYDLDGDALTYSLVTGTPDGTITIYPDGSYLYVPNPYVFGIETITYQACDDDGNCATAVLTMYVIFQNDSPIAVNDTIYMLKNTQLNYNAGTNDIEPDLELMHFNKLAGPGSGTVVFNTNGTFTYTPISNFVGTTTILYQACDPCNICSNANIVIYVIDSNNPPTAANSPSNVLNEDVTLSGSLVPLVSDPDGDNLNFELIAEPSYGTLELNPNGSFNYTPLLNYAGTDYFVFGVCDIVNQCAQATFSITIQASNDAPQLEGESVATNEDVSINTSVATNDYDPDDANLTYSILNMPLHGTATITSGGFVSYSPVSNFSGLDSLVYQACDAASLCGTAKMFINITSVNDTPTANNDVFSGNEDQAISGSVANDSDVEPGTLTYQLASQPLHGTAFIGANGNMVYTPAVNWNGSDSFTYNVCDNGSACATGLVTLNVSAVNDAPQANDDPNEFTFEDQLLNGNLAQNDNDPDGDMLTYTTTSVAQNGTFTLNANGTYSYMPDQYWNGMETFSINVCDGSNVCDQSLLTIEVVSVNDGIIAQNGSGSCNEDASISSSLLGLAFDADNDPITFSVVSNPLHGTLVLNPGGSFTYTPFANYFGPDQFTFNACDPLNACDDGVYTINVISINDAPVAVADNLSTNEDVTLNSTVANDTDADNDVLSYTVITNPMNGSLSFSANGTFVYTPQSNYFGVDMFTYEVCDNVLCDAISVTISVNTINDIPVAQNDSYQALSNTIFNDNISTNDSDVEDNALSYTIVDDVDFGTLTLSSNGAFSYLSDLDYDGGDIAIVQACDNNGGCVNSLITFNVVFGETPPNAVPDTFNMNEDALLNASVAANDSDLQGGPLTYTLVTTIAGGVFNFNSNGTFGYLPATNFNGQKTFTYSVCDNTSLCTQATATINVLSVNDVPVAGDDSFYTDEDVVLTGNVALDDSDADGQSLTFSVVVAPENGDFQLNLNGTFTYTPDANYFGNEYVVYEACDGLVCTQANVEIEVGFMNDQPIGVGENYSTNENTTLTGTVGANEIEIDPEGLLYYMIVQPLHGSVSLTAANGNFVYIPNANYFGNDEFVYMACDPCGACASAVCTLTIVHTNAAPLAQYDNYVINEGASLNANAALNDSDADSDALTYTLVTNPVLGTIQFETDGSFVYTPAAGQFGLETLEYEVCDADTCIQASIVIQINSTNAAPLGTEDNYTIYQNIELVSSVSLNDSDADDDVLTYSIISYNGQGTITLNSDGSFSYMPDLDFVGIDTVVYNVCDPEICVQTMTIINVLELNNVPTAVDDYFTTNDDDAISGNVGANDLNASTEALNYYITATTQNGIIEMAEDGQFTYTPSLAFIGNDSAMYTVCNIYGCDNGVVYFTVLDGNEAPVADNDAYTISEGQTIEGNVSTNDVDVDDNELFYTLVGTPALGTLSFSSNGSFTYAPFDGTYGLENLSYIVCDNDGACDTTEFQIQIIFVNDLPTVQNDFAEVTEGETVFGDVSLNDFDLDNDVISYALSSTVAHGIFEMETNGFYTYSPFDNYNGLETITYSACDPLGCSFGTLTISITAINAAPTIVSEMENVIEDEIFNDNIAFNDSDVDGDNLTYIVTTPPAHGTITMNLNGAYTYIPDTNYFGLDQVIVQVCDELYACANDTLFLDIQFINDFPVVFDETLETGQDQQLEGTVATNDEEYDNEVLVYSVLSDESNGIFEMNPDGSFIYIPNDGAIGTFYVYYEACDPCGACDQGVLTLNVYQIIIDNFPPTTAPLDIVLCQGETVIINMNDYISDIEELDADLQINFINPEFGEVIFNPITHLLQYTADIVSASNLSISYTVCDNGTPQQCTSGFVNVEVTPTNSVFLTDLFVENVDCYGEATGSIEIISYAGNGNITLEWADNGSSDMVRNNLVAGDYLLTLTSDAACSEPSNFSLTVSQPIAPVDAQANATDISQGGDGAIDLVITGGTAPYEVVWIGPNGFTAQTEDIDNLSEVGIYNGYITDLAGCQTSVQINLTPVVELNNNLQIVVSPNPSEGVFNLNIKGTDGGPMQYAIYDASGRMIKSAGGINWAGGHTEQIDLGECAQGIYQLRISIGNSTNVLRLVKQ